MGTLHLPDKRNLAVVLLEGGLARRVGAAADRSTHAFELAAAEESAQGASLKVWENYAAEKAAAEAAAANPAAAVLAQGGEMSNADLTKEVASLRSLVHQQAIQLELLSGLPPRCGTLMTPLPQSLLPRGLRCGFSATGT